MPPRKTTPQPAQIRKAMKGDEALRLYVEAMREAEESQEDSEDSFLSPRSLHQYKTSCRVFLDWYAELKKRPLVLDDLAPSLIRKHLTCRTQNCRPRTVTVSLFALRNWCRWLVAEGWLLTDPTAGIKPPKLDEARRDIPEEEKVLQFWQGASRLRTPARCAFARAVLCVFVYCGLRRAEALDLTVGDVDLARKRLYVRHGKGDKPRSVALPPSAAEALRHYLTIRPKAPHDGLFCVNTRFRLAERGLAALLKEVRAAAGLQGDDTLLPHGLRHAFARRLAKKTNNLAYIQNQLGHADLSTTVGYIKILETDIDQMADLAELTPHNSHPPKTRAPEHRFRVDRRSRIPR